MGFSLSNPIFFQKKFKKIQEIQENNFSKIGPGVKCSVQKYVLENLLFGDSRQAAPLQLAIWLRP